MELLTGNNVRVSICVWGWVGRGPRPNCVIDLAPACFTFVKPLLSPAGPVASWCFIFSSPPPSSLQLLIPGLMVAQAFFCLPGASPEER